MATREQLIEDFADHKYATGEKFERLINSMKVVQDPVVDPAASGTSLSFIDSISQDADGKITATKKTLDLANAHELNPFKGWYKTGDTLPTDGFDGAYLYFKDTSEQTGLTTIYRWNGTTYADTGTVVDTSNVQTFETGQAVNGVGIKDLNGDNDPNAQGVFSAEAGEELARVTTDFFSPKNLLNPNEIDTAHYVRKDNGDENANNLATVYYGCTPFFEIPEEGLICNHVGREAGGYGCGCVMYDSSKQFVGYLSPTVQGNSLVIDKTDNPTWAYVRFNLATGYTDIPNDGYAVYKGTSLPAEYSEWFEPYRAPKEAPDESVTTNKLANGSVTFEKLSEEIATTNIIPNTTTNKLADARQVNNLLDIVTHLSKNLLYLADWEEYSYNQNGELQGGDNYHHMDVPCDENTDYFLSVKSGIIGTQRAYVVLLDANKQVLSQGGIVGATGVQSVSINSGNAKYIGVSAAKAAVELQLEVGTSRSTYEEPFEPYITIKIKDELLPQATIPDGSVTTEKLADESVTINKIAETSKSFLSDNICNPDECHFEEGKFINYTNGNVQSFPSSSIAGYTGYIPIDNRGLAFTNILFGGQVIGGAVYDKDKTYIRSAGSTGIVTYQEGDAYVRFTLAAGVNANNVMVNTGTTRLPYVPYSGFKKIISPEILPDTKGQIDSELESRKIFTGKLEFVLPEKFYAVRGDVLQIFNAGLGKIIGLENRYVQQNCGIGSQWKRYFELDATLKCTFTIPSGTNAQLNDEYTCNGNVFKVTKIPSASSPTTLSCTYKGYASMPNTGTLQKITGNGAETISFTSFTDSTPTAGERNLVFKVYDDNQNVLAQSSTILKLVNYPKSPVNEKHILCIGSSTIDGGEIVGETQRRLLTNNGTPEGNGLSNITFVGRQIVSYGGQTVHLEGNSGWAWKDYATEGRGARTFRFYLSGSGNQVVQGNQYTNNGHVYTVTEVNTIEGVETIKCETDASTSSPTASGTLTPISGATYSALTYTSAVQDSSNPFWDSMNQKLDFTSYVNNYCDGSIDIVYTLLGVNAMFEGVAAQEGYVRTFIESLHTEFPNCKIVLATDAYPSMKLMMPGYGANGDYFANTYKVKVWMADVFNMYKSLSKEYSTRTEDPIDVSFELWAAQVDIDYNSEVMEKAVNTRNNSYKEPYAANTIHPGIKGYYQEADALYRSIVANLCQE
jgi:hypothetical protein